MTDSTPPGQAGAPRNTTALAMTLSILGTALLTVIAGVIWFGATGGPTGQTGAWNGTIAYPRGLDEPSHHSVIFAGDTVYFRTIEADRSVWIVAADAQTGAEKWRLKESLELSADYLAPIVEPGRDTVLVRGFGGEETTSVHLIDAETGDVRNVTRIQQAAESPRMVGGIPILVNDTELVALDATGDERWSTDHDHDSSDSLIAVAEAGDRSDQPDPGNPTDADRLLILDHEGTVTILKAGTGEVVEEAEKAVAAGSTARLAYDDILYTTSYDGTRATITAHDMTDDFSEVDSWKTEAGHKITSLSPCGAERVCAQAYGLDSQDGTDAMIIIELDEGIVLTAPQDAEAGYAYVSVAGDTTAITYVASYSESNAKTQLYDEDYEELGDSLRGGFQAVDDKTFAAVSQPPAENDSPMELYDAEVSIIDAEDGRKSRLASYPAYPGCRIGGAKLACATESGYRLWDYRA